MIKNPLININQLQTFTLPAIYNFESNKTALIFCSLYFYSAFSASIVSHLLCTPSFASARNSVAF